MRGGENRSIRRKTSRCRAENQQTQPTYDAESENRARATFVGGECSHHCAIPVPEICDIHAPPIANNLSSKLQLKLSKRITRVLHVQMKIIMLIPAKYKLINVIIIVRDLKIYDGDADKSVTSNISFMWAKYPKNKLVRAVTGRLKIENGRFTFVLRSGCRQNLKFWCKFHVLVMQNTAKM